ncbi:dephospho-CoA kinase [Ligilactobacillus salitolerans]|uniref:Dephospho-CoA kinase n=1 Tax=Ligilactobacillus salitolerans TaxID=1808352 RepID=A0A401IRA2_9LACO|nr:hypothetical protein [Ligilactobacillus salitolerans]GBG94035.1 dephospho-CoA kinase [Ligilactobacillus salitolerans]
MNYLNTPFGNFWLEFNGIKIRLEKMDLTKNFNNDNTKYSIDSAVVLKPHIPRGIKRGIISLKSDVDLHTSVMPVDRVSDERYDGFEWHNEEWNFAGGIFLPMQNLESYYSVSELELPSIELGDKVLPDDVLFEVSYKNRRKLSKGNDLSLYFSMDLMDIASSRFGNND